MTKQPARKKTTVKTLPVEPTLKVIHTAKCPSLTKKSTITYQLSEDDEAKIYMRINSNSGGGYFSNEWIFLESIISLISDATVDNSIASHALFVLFKGKSVNTQSFLLAALKQVGVLTPFPGKHRHYVFVSTEKLQKIIDKSRAAK